VFHYYKRQYQKKVKNSSLHSIQKRFDDISETTESFALGFSGGFLLKDVHFKQICEGE
jgi:hypothetical protein